MSATASIMSPLGTRMPPFRLQDPHGRWVSSFDLEQAPAALVMFICNHCPYVKHIQRDLTKLVAEYQRKGVAVAAINSNDAGAYPDDGPEPMARIAEEIGYTFPYLMDGDQLVAKAFGAACTPDFFVFDKRQILVYRGQMDGSRPGNHVPVTGKDLRAALDAVLKEKPVPATQKPSVGCNIKWKPGNEPDYFKG